MSPELNRTAAALLVRAYEFAREAAVDPLQFALPVRELETAELGLTDVRWLLLRNFASLVKEVTVPGDAERRFRPLPFTALTRAAHLTLTEQGAAELGRRLDAAHATATTERHPQGPPIAPEPHPHRPKWNAGRRELLVGPVVVKRFRVPAPNQELILQVFEEEGWPSSIEDPLPPADEIDCQHRLRATIKSLNRSQCAALIRFHVNGGGQAIYWDPV